MARPGRGAGRPGLERLVAATGKVLRLAPHEVVGHVTERLRLRLEQHRADMAYRLWAERHSTLTGTDRRAIRSRLRELPYQPLISVIMPVYDTREAWLRQAIDSVLRQHYSHWELCLADDNSSQPHVRSVLEEYARRDPRIKLVFRDSNGHISAASNSALALATGEYVALLDHDDELAEHALYTVVEELNRHPDADLLYSDEDKIDGRGRRYHPHFKPDWNPDLFYSMNLVTHLAVYRRSVLGAVGGFSEGVEGSQDYDLTLRVIERIPASAIRHIPHVLYHWRAIPGSVALASGEKEYAHDAARRAIRAHLERRGVRAEVRSAPEHATLHRVVYPLPSPAPLVSLILPVTRRPELLHRSLAALLAQTNYAPFELLLAGGRLDEALPLPPELERDPRVRRLTVRAESDGATIAASLPHARGDIVALLGFVEPIAGDWLAEMVSHVLRPEIGAVGAKLYDEAGAIAHAGIVLGAGGVAGRLYRGVPRNQACRISRLWMIQGYSAVAGACLVVRRELLERVGGVDAANLPSVYFDVDLCLRLRAAGHRTLWTPYAELTWLGADAPGPPAADAAGRALAGEEQYMRLRWGSVLERDPNYNANLSLEREDGSLAARPRRPVPWADAGPPRGRRAEVRVQTRQHSSL
jgi:GT2 family glycosyltransferase